MIIILDISAVERTGTPIWCTEYSSTFDNMSDVNAHWIVINNAFIDQVATNYTIDRDETVFTRDGNLVMRTFQRNGTDYWSRLRSKHAFSPSKHQGDN